MEPFRALAQRLQLEDLQKSNLQTHRLNAMQTLHLWAKKALHGVEGISVSNLGREDSESDFYRAVPTFTFDITFGGYHPKIITFYPDQDSKNPLHIIVRRANLSGGWDAPDHWLEVRDDGDIRSWDVVKPPSSGTAFDYDSFTTMLAEIYGK